MLCSITKYTFSNLFNCIFDSYWYYDPNKNYRVTNMEAKIYESSLWVDETQSSVLKKSLNKLLNNIDFNCLNFVDKHFSPQGYTALWLLAESHLAVHTFPEKRQSYIQISCCNKEKYQLFLQHLQSQFNVL